MNETPNEVIARVKRQAEGVFLDLTSQGDKRIETLKRTSTYQSRKIAELAGLVMELADAFLLPEEPQPAPEVGPTREELRAASQAMRDRAAELFSDRLSYSRLYGGYVTRDSYQPVVFTPYGWQLAEDVLDSADADIYVR